MHLFGTSAVIAAHTRNHGQFAWASEQLPRADGLALCAHSLAGCYAVMTASPQFRYPPDDVARFLRFLEQTWTVIPLTPTHYLRAAERCRNLGLQGGAIYDTLMAEATLQSGATGLVTLNARHFRRPGEDVAWLVIAP